MTITSAPGDRLDTVFPKLVLYVNRGRPLYSLSERGGACFYTRVSIHTAQVQP